MEWDQIADRWAAMARRLRSDMSERPKETGRITKEIGAAVSGKTSAKKMNANDIDQTLHP